MTCLGGVCARRSGMRRISSSRLPFALPSSSAIRSSLSTTRMMAMVRAPSIARGEEAVPRGGEAADLPAYVRIAPDGEDDGGVGVALDPAVCGVDGDIERADIAALRPPVDPGAAISPGDLRRLARLDHGLERERIALSIDEIFEVIDDGE